VRALRLQVISRSAVATAITEEVLRLKPAGKLLFRRARKDTHLAGYRVPEGQSICLYVGLVRHHACTLVCLPACLLTLPPATRHTLARNAKTCFVFATTLRFSTSADDLRGVWEPGPSTSLCD
jgi:Cytochrome P450